jgi:hypothetical protein
MAVPKGTEKSNQIGGGFEAFVEVGATYLVSIH